MTEDRNKLYDLFGRFSNIALFCMALGAVGIVVWAVLVMGANGFQVGATLIIFGYCLNWVLKSWEDKNKIDLVKKE